MTEAQRKRTDVRILYWSYTSIILILFSWNIIGLLVISEIITEILQKPFKNMLSIREKLMQYYIDKRKIERDGEIGSKSKYKEKK